MTQTTPKPTPADRLVEPISRPMEPSELDRVIGGNVTMGEFTVIKKVDKASPQ